MMLLNLFVQLLSASEIEKNATIDEKMSLLDKETLIFKSGTPQEEIFDLLNRFKAGGDKQSEASSVKKLNLSDRDLTEIPSELGITFPNLEELNLNINNLESLDKDAFKDMKNLKSLLLGLCIEDELPVNIFDGLENLEILGLASNNLETLNEDIFKDTVNLKELYLNENNLKNLPVNVFKGLKNLKILYLSENQLTELDEKLFEPLVNLEQLYLDENEIDPLPIELFENLKKKGLKFLDVNDNYHNIEPSESQHSVPKKKRNMYIMIGILIIVTLGGLIFALAKTSESSANSNINV